VALVLQRHRDIEAIAALAGALQEQFAVAPRPFLRDLWCFLDQALEVLHLPAQILFESGEFLLLLIERRVGAGASACHGAPDDSGRSGKRKGKARSPRKSSTVGARPGGSGGTA